MKRLSSDPQEAVTASGSGLALDPVAAVDISGAVVPCQEAAVIRTARAANRSLTLLVTVTEVSPPDAIK